MADFLSIFAQYARDAIDDGYYKVAAPRPRIHASLNEAITNCKSIPIISEIKFASPSIGSLRGNSSIEAVALAMQRGGAVGISILTERSYFKGSLESFIKVSKHVQLPLLMKDFIISPVQLEVANEIGANAVLLIKALFDQGYGECDIDAMIARAHKLGLEVLLETHTQDEFSSAINASADLIGINNRDLRSLEVDLNISKKILQGTSNLGKVVVSESGIKTADDIRFLKKSGADAFLVGTAIMTADDVELKVKELRDVL